MAPGPAHGNTHGRIANPPGGVGQAAPDSPDRRVRCSGMMGIHHEDPKNTKGAGAMLSLSVLYNPDGITKRPSARPFVSPWWIRR